MEFTGPIQLLLNGAPILTAEQASVRFISNDKAVKTLALGLAGFSDGAEEVSINSASAVPESGFEKDYPAYVMGHITVRLTVIVAGRSYICEGRFLETGVESSVDTPTAMPVVFHGRLASPA